MRTFLQVVHKDVTRGMKPWVAKTLGWPFAVLICLVSIVFVPFILVSCILGVLIDYAIRGVKSIFYTGGEK